MKIFLGNLTGYINSEYFNLLVGSSLTNGENLILIKCTLKYAPWRRFGMNFFNHLIQKLLSLLTVWGLLFLGTAPIHEWGHVMMTHYLGGEAYVTYSPGYMATGGFTHFIVIPEHGLWWVYFAGGLTVFLGYMILWFWAWKSKTFDDMYIEIPALTIALWQISYAFIEAYIYPHNQELFHQVVAYPPIFGLVAGLGIEFKKLLQWLTTKEDIVRKKLYW